MWTQKRKELANAMILAFDSHLGKKVNRPVWEPLQDRKGNLEFRNQGALFDVQVDVEGSVFLKNKYPGFQPLHNLGTNIEYNSEDLRAIGNLLTVVEFPEMYEIVKQREFGPKMSSSNSFLHPAFRWKSD